MGLVMGLVMDHVPEVPQPRSSGSVLGAPLAGSVILMYFFNLFQSRTTWAVSRNLQSDCLHLHSN